MDTETGPSPNKRPCIAAADLNNKVDRNAAITQLIEVVNEVRYKFNQPEIRIINITPPLPTARQQKCPPLPTEPQKPKGKSQRPRRRQRRKRKQAYKPRKRPQLLLRRKLKRQRHNIELSID